MRTDTGQHGGAGEREPGDRPEDEVGEAMTAGEPAAELDGSGTDDEHDEPGAPADGFDEDTAAASDEQPGADDGGSDAPVDESDGDDESEAEVAGDEVDGADAAGVAERDAPADRAVADDDAAPTDAAGGSDRAVPVAAAAAATVVGAAAVTPVNGAPAAARTRTDGQPWREALVVADPPSHRRGRVLAAAAAVVVLGGGLAIALASRAGDKTSAADPSAAPAVLGATATTAPATTAPAASTTAGSTTAPATTVAPTTVAPTTVPPTTVPPSTAPVATTAPATAASVAQDAGIPNIYTPVRWAIFQGGKVQLLGRVPNQQVADTIAAKATAVVGPGNVSVEYIIDPTAPAPPAAPLYVRDTVQFAPGSTAVAPQFAPLLDLGVRLMQQNAGVKIWVLGRADNVGDPDANLMLSLRRAQAVIAYLQAAGIDESRLIAVPLGSDAGLGDNATPEGRQQNRSVEFVISGLLA